MRCLRLQVKNRMESRQPQAQRPERRGRRGRKPPLCDWSPNLRPYQTRGSARPLPNPLPAGEGTLMDRLYTWRLRGVRPPRRAGLRPCAPCAHAAGPSSLRHPPSAVHLTAQFPRPRRGKAHTFHASAKRFPDSPPSIREMRRESLTLSGAGASIPEDRALEAAW
jgi:hypothetical protein